MGKWLFEPLIPTLAAQVQPKLMLDCPVLHQKGQYRGYQHTRFSNNFFVRQVKGRKQSLVEGYIVLSAKVSSIRALVSCHGTFEFLVTLDQTSDMFACFLDVSKSVTWPREELRKKTADKVIQRLTWINRTQPKTQLFKLSQYLGWNTFDHFVWERFDRW